jgi:hypothetical protein
MNGAEVSAGPAGATDANKAVPDTPKAEQTVSDTENHEGAEDSRSLVATTQPSAQENGNNSSSLAARGDAPATLHAAEMLVMAKEFVKIFREQHPDRRQPGLFAHTAAGQQVLLTQLLRPTQVPSRTH